MQKILAILTIFIFSGAAILASESLLPTGYNLLSGYDLNTSEITPGDTLVITRTLDNNESFALSGLYFSENIPSQFSIVSYSIKLNGVDIPVQYSSNLSPSIINGYNYCEWLVDSPNGYPTNNIYAGQTLIFELKLTCQTPGNYSLPFHSSSFYGNNSGFFSTDNAIAITVSEAPDVTPPAAIIDLEAVLGP